MVAENELHFSPFKSVTHVAVVTATGKGRVTASGGDATSKWALSVSLSVVAVLKKEVGRNGFRTSVG